MKMSTPPGLRPGVGNAAENIATRIGRCCITGPDAPGTIAHVLGSKVPKLLRDWANARFPAAVAAYRDALVTTNQLRTFDARFRSLERAVHSKGGSAQSIHEWECSIF